MDFSEAVAASSHKSSITPMTVKRTINSHKKTHNGKRLQVRRATIFATENYLASIQNEREDMKTPDGDEVAYLGKGGTKMELLKPTCNNQTISKYLETLRDIVSHAGTQ
jgi:hypothetical protein